MLLSIIPVQNLYQNTEEYTRQSMTVAALEITWFQHRDPWYNTENMYVNESLDLFVYW